YDGAAKQQTAAWLRHVDCHQIPSLIILLSIQPIVTVLVSDDYGVLADCRIKFNVQNPLDSVQVGNNIVRQSIQLSSNQTISRNYNLAPDPVVADLDGIKRRSEEHTSELQSRENLVC